MLIKSDFVHMWFGAAGLVAPASRRQFCAVQELQKLPAGRRRYENRSNRNEFARLTA
jgi:hypothetical protein